MNLDERTYALIGAAMKVHRELGPGLREVCYQRALSIELRRRGIIHQREFAVPVLYDGETVGIFRADFDCYGQVLLEVKAEPFHSPQAVLQLAQYVSAGGRLVGLLLNFGLPSLQVKRVLPRSGRSAESGLPR